ncbi:MAG: hypothetical protein ACSLFO_08035 [Acidimicrobiales bacterium]
MYRFRRSSRLLVAALAVFAFTAAACGDDDDTVDTESPVSDEEMSDEEMSDEEMTDES